MAVKASKLKSPGPRLLLGLDRKGTCPSEEQALDHPVFSSPSLPTSLQCVALSWSQNND